MLSTAVLLLWFITVFVAKDFFVCLFEVSLVTSFLERGCSPGSPHVLCLVQFHDVSIFVPFDAVNWIWNLILLVPDHCVKAFSRLLFNIFMPPTSKKLNWHIGFGLSVCPFVTLFEACHIL